MKAVLILSMVLFAGCSSLKLKDLNKIDAGMSQKQVQDKLGEPTSKKMVDNREIFEYDMKDENGEVKPRIVVFQDREVIFYGRPSEYAAQQEKKNAGGGSATVTVSPTISPTISPVFNIGTPAQASQQQPMMLVPMNQQRAPAANSYLHSYDQ